MVPLRHYRAMRVVLGAFINLSEKLEWMPNTGSGFIKFVIGEHLVLSKAVIVNTRSRKKTPGTPRFSPF